MFFLFTKDDPDLARAPCALAPSPSRLPAMLEPLKNIQVWRFSLYYFFVFGGFVALALWLPRYLIGVYGLDITTAGMIGAAYSIPASRVPRLWRPCCPTSSARGASCTGRSSSRWPAPSCCPIRRPITSCRASTARSTFSTRLGICRLHGVAFVLGFFMSLGKAAVYKHIPVYYPGRVGAVGGVVGLVGGLGGFVLPIAFGALNDLTGVWQSCFWLLFAVVAAALVWMHVAVRQMERAAVGAGVPGATLPELPEMQPIHGPAQQGALAATGAIEDWRPEDEAFWEAPGRAIARRNLWISVPCLLLSFAVWMVWSVVVAKLPAVGFAFTHRPAVLAGRAAGPVGRDAARLLRVHAGDLRRPAVDDADHVVAAAPGARHGLRGAGPGDAVLDLPGARAALRPRRRQLRVVHGQHLVLLPEGREGQRAGHQRRARQSRRQRRAVRGAAGDHRRACSAGWAARRRWRPQAA